MIGGLAAQSGPVDVLVGARARGRRSRRSRRTRTSTARSGVLNASGAIETKGHPFFEPIGTNGRACVTCHQPSDGMALSVRSIRDRWTATRGQRSAVCGRGRDELSQPAAGRSAIAFAPARTRSVPHRACRGRQCVPTARQSIQSSRSRSSAIPPAATPIRSTGCAARRRRSRCSAVPRPVANTKYTTHQNFGVGPFVGKNGMPAATDPETGRPTSMNLMSDARAPTLAAAGAGRGSGRICRSPVP